MRRLLLPLVVLSACAGPARGVRAVEMEVAQRPTETASVGGAPAPLPPSELAATIDGICELVEGVVRCAGRNMWGEVGDGTSEPHREWVRVPGTEGAVQLTAGGQHVCVRMKDGTARCWGQNEFGQLGDGVGSPPRHFPIPVGGLRDIEELRAGVFHTCARVRGGDVLCWGGKIDSVVVAYDLDPELRLHPTRIAKAATELAAGHERTYAKTKRGWVTWAPQRHVPPVPQPLSPLDGAVSIASGWSDECAVTSQGDVRCWGASHRSSYARPHEPSAAQAIPGLPPIARVVVGRAHSCALTKDGRVYCWPELHGHFGAEPAPALVAGIVDAVDLAAGFDFTCARLRAGNVKCWGRTTEFLPSDSVIEP